MSTQPTAASIRAGLAFAGLLTLTACDQWALSVGGNGLIFVGVSGNANPAWRFRVRARQAEATQLLDVPASGELSLGGLAPGEVELTLLLPPACRVGGANPQTLMVSADQPTRAVFSVRCSP